jgi:hypothetical protein
MLWRRRERALLPKGRQVEASGRPLTWPLSCSFLSFFPPPLCFFILYFLLLVKTQKGERKKWREILERCDFIFCFRSRETHFKLRAKTSNSELTSLQSSPPPFLIIFKTYWFLFLARLGNQQSYFLKGHCRHLFREFWFGDSVVASWWRACFISRKRKTENKWVRCIKGSSRRNEIGIEISDGQKIKNKREQTRNV